MFQSTDRRNFKETIMRKLQLQELQCEWTSATLSNVIICFGSCSCQMEWFMLVVGLLKDDNGCSFSSANS